MCAFELAFHSSFPFEEIQYYAYIFEIDDVNRLPTQSIFNSPSIDCEYQKKVNFNKYIVYFQFLWKNKYRHWSICFAVTRPGNYKKLVECER